MLYRNMKDMERLEKNRKVTTIGYLVTTLLLVITAGVCAIGFDNTALAIVVLIAAVCMIPVYLVMMITQK